MVEWVNNFCKQRALLLPHHCPHRVWSVASSFHKGAGLTEVSVTQQISGNFPTPRNAGWTHKEVYLVHFSLPMHANLGAKLCVFVHVQDVDIYIYVHVNNMYIVHCVKVRFAIMSLNCTKALAIQGIYTYYLPTCTHRYPSGWWSSPNWRTSWPESVCHAHSPGGLQPWVLPSVWPMRWMLSLDRRLGTQFGSRTVPAQELYSSKHKRTFKSRHMCWRVDVCVCVHMEVCACDQFLWSVLVIRSCDHDKCMHN